MARPKSTNAMRIYGLPIVAGVIALGVAATLFRPGFTIAPPSARIVVAEAGERASARGPLELPTPAPAPQATYAGRSVNAPPLNLAASERDRLFMRGQALMEAGDIAAARLLLRRAADAGHAGATFALASTYDPNVLASVHVMGLEGEPTHAKALYEKALADGIDAARSRLSALGG